MISTEAALAASRGSMASMCRMAGESPACPVPTLPAWRNDGVNLLHQGVEVERLGDVVLGALLEQPHRGVDVAVAGDEDERRQAALFAQQLLEQLRRRLMSGRRMSLMTRA